MEQLTVITPTVGTEHLEQAIESVRTQTVPVRHLIIVDGYVHRQSVDKIVQRHAGRCTEVIYIPNNIGGDGWYGHRHYIAGSALARTPYVAFLDEDNYYEPTFAERVLSEYEYMGAVSCRRNIVREDGSLIGVDNKESIVVQNSFGYHLADISTMTFNVEHFYFKKYPTLLYNKWGADRLIAQQLAYDLGHYHIREPLVNYRSKPAMYKFFEEVCK